MHEQTVICRQLFASHVVGFRAMKRKKNMHQMIIRIEPKRLSEKAVYSRPRSIYQYSNMAPRLSGQTSIFGVVFFVSKSLLGIEEQKKLEQFRILT